jgi:hypothetical protein
MEHTKSSFYFQDKRGDWQLDYTYKTETNNNGRPQIKATIYLNNSIYQDFDKIPWTKTDNPTKTQAKELIAEAKKLNKESDKREAKLNKILN